MTEQWQELKETIAELRDNDGIGTQQEVCKFLANLMDVLEKQMQEPCEDAISRQAAIDENPSSFSHDHENDLISRQDAIDALYHVDEYNARSVKAIKTLPSAQPKIGKWILSGGYWRCSECKEKALLKLDKAKGNCKEYEPVRSIFCPNCGMKMLQTDS